MRAKTILYTDTGARIRVLEPLNTARDRITGRQPATAIEFRRVTDHGTVKRLVLAAGAVVRLEEA